MADLKARGGQSRVYRGSQKRIRKLTTRENWARNLLLLTLIVLFMLLVVIPWVSRHLPADYQHESGTSLGAAKGQ
jgi:hypothetical protein